MTEQESDGLRELLPEAAELVRERPCHRPECMSGELGDPSHRRCQRIRSFITRADAALGS